VLLHHTISLLYLYLDWWMQCCPKGNEQCSKLAFEMKNSRAAMTAVKLGFVMAFGFGEFWGIRVAMAIAVRSTN